MSFAVTQLVGFGAGAAPPASINYRTGAYYQGSQSSHTFTTQDIGTAANDRYVIVFAAGYDGSSSNRTISGVTIGGNSASLFSGTTATVNSGYLFGGFYYLLVTSGTTADIAITFSGAVASFSSITVWAVTGLQSLTPVGTNTNTSTSGTLSSISASTNADGVGFGVLLDVATSPTVTPTGVSVDYNPTLPSVNWSEWFGSSTTSGSNISIEGSGLGSRALSVLMALR